MTSRTGRKRFWLFVVLGFLLPAVAVGCSRDDQNKKEQLLEIIEATKARTRTFAYSDAPLGGSPLEVVGIVEDDYRYKARLTIEGTDVLEEVAIDDTLGMRFLDPGRLGFFLDPQKLAAALQRSNQNLVTKPGQQAVRDVPIEALEQGRWVVDPVGAPSLVQKATDVVVPGNDPVKDALTALDYVSRVVTAANPSVFEFNINDLSPTYKDEEDDFPKPQPGAKVKRYDVPLVRFPKVGAAGGGAGGPGRNQDTFPKPENFRKMAIYVRDGLVVEVREHIDVPSRLKDFREAFELPENLTVEQAIQAINKVREASGQDEVFRPRRMQLSLSTEISVDNTISLPPAGQFAPGNLSIIKGRGQQKPAGKTVPGSAPGTTVPPATPPPEPQALAP